MVYSINICKNINIYTINHLRETNKHGLTLYKFNTMSDVL